MLPEKPNAPMRPGHSCDDCGSSYECKTLNTVLTIMARHKDRLKDQTLHEKYRELMEYLGDAAWAYPNGVKPCRLADAPKAVQALTGELLRIWQTSESTTRLSESPSLYQEEVHCE